MPDCTAIISGAQAASDTVISACIAHGATIDAARIQAKATGQSSHWTLFAAAIAFFSALYAARAPGVIQRRERQRLARAYRYRIYQVILSISGLIPVSQKGIDDAKQAYEHGAKPVEIIIRRIPVPEELLPKEWRDHALLDYDEIELVIDLHKQLQSYTTTADNTFILPEANKDPDFYVCDTSKIVHSLSLQVIGTLLYLLKSRSDEALKVFQANVVNVNQGDNRLIIRRNIKAKLSEWPEWPERIFGRRKAKCDHLRAKKGL
jgi:hypothetical protein